MSSQTCEPAISHHYLVINRHQPAVLASVITNLSTRYMSSLTCHQPVNLSSIITKPTWYLLSLTCQSGIIPHRPVNLPSGITNLTTYHQSPAACQPVSQSSTISCQLVICLSPSQKSTHSQTRELQL